MPSYDDAGRHREPRARRHHRSESSGDSPRKRKESSSRLRGTSSHALSIDALAQLNAAGAVASTTGESSNVRPQEDRRRERREREREREQSEGRGQGRGERADREERREARREKEERRERRKQREKRDRQQAAEREARRQEQEEQERREREEGLGRRDSRRVSETRRRQSREVYETSRTRSEDRRRRHRDEDHERERQRKPQSRGGRGSGRDYTDDERREKHTSYDRYDHYEAHDKNGQRQSMDRTTKHYYIDHEDDDPEDDEGYDRVEAGGAADRRHRARRDRRIPSGAVLEEGRSRGLRKTSAGRTAAAAAAAGAGVGAAVAAAGGGGGGGGGIFGRWRGHLRGGFGGLSSRGSNNSSVTRDSIERSKEEQLYYAKQRQTPPWTRKKKLIIFGGIGGALLIILIAVVAVVVSKKHSSSSGDSTSSSTSGCTGLACISPSDIPADAPSYLNPYVWVSVTDFNLTYTNETVGGLPVMGLNTSYDDSKAANSKTKPLNEAWGSYTTTPARGVNLGGWLSIEPFITPSLFNFNSRLGIIDEYTMCSYLGTTKCASTLENHYATFVTESTFEEIAAAGLDHVRIPFSYWAVEVYDGDPYLFRTSWRYLLRGIEWARKNGLRVNLDLHGLPGSQNGWNHSGRQGVIGWMNGTDGDLNVQRSLDVHDKLSQFFAQPRYKYIISHYGLANEPRMTFLPMSTVMNWTQTAAAIVRKNGLNNDTLIVFGDGFYGLDKWQGQPNNYNLVLDVHQYEIFNNAQLVYTHAEKIEYACSDWTEQTEESMDTATGYGPTIVAEWSQADTDCATYLGNVGNGNRWTGTYDVGNASLNALTPMCPLQNQTCSCTNANADPSTYSDVYKSFLLTFAEAQMDSFEKGMGWWYWTWDTESATQWSYKQGMAAGVLPTDATTRSFSCSSGSVPSFDGLPEYY
ncbi:hypothetical protein SCUCBS95973_005897 [Sporothrix curviconia]|uniref:glucan 1,3-beta-glucosidase n=1 Tax=Sporothrix curviconia TaxID=1260050 RepID=A0ABP0C0L5_9PEZI